MERRREVANRMINDIKGHMPPNEPHPMDRSRNQIKSDMTAEANMFPTLFKALKATVAELSKYEAQKGFNGAEALQKGRESIEKVKRVIQVS